MDDTGADPRCVAPRADEVALARLRADEPASLAAMFARRVASTPDREAYRTPDGHGGWTSRTWAETGTVVTELAAGLLALGLGPQDPVAIISATRLEWLHADLAVICAGGATTTVYPTSTPEDVRHVLSDSGSRIAVVENSALLATVLGTGVPLARIVVIEKMPGIEADEAVITLDRLREIGREHLAGHPEAVTSATAAVRPEHLATLIYTSGTTGRPKGVRLSHASWVYEGLATAAVGMVSADDLGYFWLPMAHSFGKVLLSTQIAVGHAAAIDGDSTRIIENLPVVRPTVTAAVPRIFEKVHAGVVAAVGAEGGVRARVFGWAVGVGREVSRLRRQGREPSGLLAVRHRVADRLVLSTVRARFGGRLDLFVSGSAALSSHVAEWFHAMGLLVAEGYGLTETSAGSFVNRRNRYEFGTVGLPLPGTEVRVDADGEILIRGPGVMVGYHNLPEETAAVLGPDGWLRTGDIGEITASGALRITDRKKDMIKTSGGKYVAPQPIQTAFTAICPLAGQMLVHGEGRHFVSALVALDPDAVTAWAAANGMAGAPFADVARSPAMRATIEQSVERLNAGLGQWERIRKVAILDRILTVEDGDLTPSLKLKRRAVERKYAGVLDGFYS